MKRLLPMLSTALRLGLAGLFLFAAVRKLTDIDAFFTTIYAFGMIPEALVIPAGVFILAVEIIGSLLLVFRKKGGVESLFLLTLLFTGVLAYGIHLGLDIDCGCFGPEDPEATLFSGLRTSLYRDFALLAALAFVRMTSQTVPFFRWRTP